MTREDTVKILRIISNTYPSWKPQSMSEVADVWAKVFEQDDFEAIEAGLMAYIQNDTTGFAPSPGQIRAGIKKAVDPVSTIEEDIAQLRKAVSEGIYHSEREFDELSEIMQLAVGSHQNIRAWAMQPIDEFESVTLSHVRRAYRNIEEQKKYIDGLKPLRSDVYAIGSASEHHQISG